MILSSFFLFWLSSCAVYPESLHPQTLRFSLSSLIEVANFVVGVVVVLSLLKLSSRICEGRRSVTVNRVQPTR